MGVYTKSLDHPEDSFGRKIKTALAEPEFHQRLEDLLRQDREVDRSDAWFHEKHSDTALTLIAYFSMEFMLTEALPIYSGGLGNVAGDQMKAANDLGVPVVGVGLLYGQGSQHGRITLEYYLSNARIEWHGVDLDKPGWGNDSHSLAVTMHNFASSRVRYIAINAYWKPLEFQLPPVAVNSAAGWLRLVDTSLPSPEDIVDEAAGVPVQSARYIVNPRSVVMLHYDYATEPATDQV